MLFRVSQHVVGTRVWPKSFLVFAVLIWFGLYESLTPISEWPVSPLPIDSEQELATSAPIDSALGHQESCDTATVQCPFFSEQWASMVNSGIQDAKSCLRL